MFTSSKGADDIYSLSDQGLADTFKFIEEVRSRYLLYLYLTCSSFFKKIGFGNWGSVWLCEPRIRHSSDSNEEEEYDVPEKVAVKIVHRNKTPTTSARVRSLLVTTILYSSFHLIPFFLDGMKWRSFGLWNSTLIPVLSPSTTLSSPPLML